MQNRRGLQRILNCVGFDYQGSELHNSNSLNLVFRGIKILIFKLDHHFDSFDFSDSDQIPRTVGKVTKTYLYYLDMFVFVNNDQMCVCIMGLTGLNASSFNKKILSIS